MQPHSSIIVFCPKAEMFTSSPNISCTHTSRSRPRDQRSCLTYRTGRIIESPFARVHHPTPSCTALPNVSRLGPFSMLARCHPVLGVLSAHTSSRSTAKIVIRTTCQNPWSLNPAPQNKLLCLFPKGVLASHFPSNRFSQYPPR
jgi:hypothetical protein